MLVQRSRENVKCGDIVRAKSVEGDQDFRDEGREGRSENPDAGTGTTQQPLERTRFSVFANDVRSELEMRMRREFHRLRSSAASVPVMRSLPAKCLARVSLQFLAQLFEL